MSYETFRSLCEQRHVTPAVVSRATGIASSTLTEWKKGRYAPKTDKLQKIAEYFGVSVEYLMTGEEPEEGYYVNPETAEMAQQIFVNPDLRLLFDVAKDVTPEQLKLLHDLAMSWKVSND